MKIFLDPSIALHSPAMVRIQNALIKYCPPQHKIVNDRSEADLCIFYPISCDWTHYLEECINRGQEYALIQCCYKSGRIEEDKLQFDLWRPWWLKSLVVWSYLDLLEGKIDNEIPFYHAPLGIDEAFLSSIIITNPKRDYIVTTGTVHGNGQEAILECWEAARECGLGVAHVGSFPKGIAGNYNVPHAQIVTGCTDQTLRGIYQNAKYVCSLRYIEGFELPALESLSCGTRSIVFTQPAMTKWYWGFADFVPECEGQELIDHLVNKFKAPYESISQSTVDEVRSRFDWGLLCWRFWSIVEEELKQRGKRA